MDKVSGHAVSFEAANILFVDSHFKVKDNFTQQCKRYYDAKVNSFDFQKDGSLFQKTVNDWVSRKTHVS